MVVDGKIVIEISELVVKYLMHELSEDEQKRLECWREESPHNQQLFQELCDGQLRRHEPGKYDIVESEMAFRRFLVARKQKEQAGKYRILLSSLKYAAMFVLPLLIAGILWWHNVEQVQDTVGLANSSLPYFGRKPMLTLSDGKEMVVDKANLVLSRMQGVRITGQDSSELVYFGQIADNSQLQYHTLTTPAQCDYHFILSDGTKVWINAKSSVKYPVVFGADERVVYASGEIYLEVAKDTSRPFYVVTNDLKVKVLGTSFNVNAYEDENFVTVTLVEGKVAAYTKDKSYALTPDKQLYFNKDNQLAEIRPVNVYNIIAWKDGRYIFKGQTLNEVAKVLERWYEVRVIFENKHHANEIYTGIVYKEEPLESFIMRLNASSTYHCYLENNIVYIR